MWVQRPRDFFRRRDIASEPTARICVCERIRLTRVWRDRAGSAELRLDAMTVIAE